MTDPNTNKPIVFISHATSDGEFAVVVKQEIEKVFGNSVNVFCTSSPGAIGAGKDWLEEIESKLSNVQAVIVIVTPVSIERPWLWFEVGATWLNSRSGSCTIYPLCAPEINLADLPSPLDRLKALSLGKARDLKLLFEALIEKFGFGRISNFRASNITSRIPKYNRVKISSIDLAEKKFYSGRYNGYHDDELMEVIDTKLFQPDEVQFAEELDFDRNREDIIHLGKLLHYKEIDRNLDLPPGTAKRLLIKVAKRYQLKPAYSNKNVIRFKVSDSRQWETMR